MNDDDAVRQMLERRAGDVSPDPEAWERIESGLGEPAAPRLLAQRHPRPLLSVAAAVVVIAALAVAIDAQPDGTQVATVRAGQSDGSGEAGDEPASTTIPLDAVDHLPEPILVPPSPPTFVTAPAAPGAPVLLRAAATATRQEGSYSQGTITLTFDQPVNPGTGMNLIVYGSDDACDGPDGNSHDAISGAGTPTITFDATSLGVPTSYITIIPGFVTGTRSGDKNAGVGCTAVPTDVKLAPTTTTAPHAPGPALMSVRAAATQAQGPPFAGRQLWSGTITVTFDQPVQLAGADEYMTAMRLVVFADDAACGGPDGNSHRVISGNGTSTLTLDATSLAAPTSYIILAPGFVKSVATGVENEPVGCTSVATTTP